MNDLEASTETSPTAVISRTQTFDTAKAFELRLKGLTYEAIGAALCPEQPYTPQTVQGHLHRFQKFIQDPDSARTYEEHRPKILNALEFELVASLADEDALSKASLNNRAYALQQVSNLRRLESGQSTQNLGVLSKHIVALDQGLFGAVDKKAK